MSMEGDGDGGGGRDPMHETVAVEYPMTELPQFAPSAQVLLADEQNPLKCNDGAFTQVGSLLLLEPG